jgi:hypothetical protein
MSRTDLDREAREAAVLTEEIEQTRAALGQTLAQLAERVDVKARVRAAGARTTARVRHAARAPISWVVLGASGATAVAVALAVNQRNQRRRRLQWRRQPRWRQLQWRRQPKWRRQLQRKWRWR